MTDDAILDLSPAGKLTIDEWHGLVLGGSVGLLAGLSRKGRRIVNNDPWYPLAALALGYVIGREIARRRLRMSMHAS